MFVLVAGVSGHLAAPRALGGVGIDGLILPFVIAAGALIAYLVVIAPLLVPAVRRNNSRSRGLRTLFPGNRFDSVTAMITVRVAGAVAIASLVSLPLVCTARTG